MFGIFTPFDYWKIIAKAVKRKITQSVIKVLQVLPN